MEVEALTATRTCREFMMTMAYADTRSRTNCATCVKWDRETERCADEKGVVKRYEDTPNFEDFKRMMEDSKSIVIP